MQIAFAFSSQSDLTIAQNARERTSPGEADTLRGIKSSKQVVRDLLENL